jgi:membrane protease YdiL (CAAX protease family)
LDDLPSGAGGAAWTPSGSPGAGPACRRAAAPAGLAVAALTVPVAGAVAVELRPHLHEVSRAALVAAPVVGSINAVAEELLWRALPAAAHPDDPVRGWLWPAAAFTAWHLGPLGVRHGRGRLLAGAGLIGLGYGWIAWGTGSIAATILPHAATDSCGIRAAQATWLTRAGRTAGGRRPVR